MPLVCAESQQAYQFVLWQIAVLELVNVDIVPASLVLTEHFRFAPPQLFRQHEQIVEIDAIIGA